jgi:hypothetical protein
LDLFVSEPRSRNSWASEVSRVRKEISGADSRFLNNELGLYICIQEINPFRKALIATVDFSLPQGRATIIRLACSEQTYFRFPRGERGNRLL